MAQGTRASRILLEAITITIVSLAGTVAAFGQTPPPAAASGPSSSSRQALDPPPVTSAETPCVEPAPAISLEDYDGPFKKLASSASRKLERKTVHRPHHKPGTLLCSLDAGEKFRLFVDDTVEPVTFLGGGFFAGLSQAQDTDSQFGQGAQGYGKRYGAALADSASGSFFGNFLYPALLREDPRYFRMAHGSTWRRLRHAMRHTFLARSDSGKLMPNFSEWMGTASAQVLSNLYHPGNERGFAPAAQAVGISIASDMGFDVLREFWPEVAHKLRLPFQRHVHEPPHSNQTKGSR